MALTLNEIKDLIAFGRDCGLQSLTAEGIAIVYGRAPGAAEDEQPQDDNASNLPPELRHYSARGRAAFGKR